MTMQATASKSHVPPMAFRSCPELDTKAYPIRFAPKDFGDAQDREWCEVYVRGEWRRLRLHDYGEIYQIPGLYEHLFYNVLECCSPKRVVDLLGQVLREWPQNPTELAVLDVGAGNGMVGERLRALGIQKLVGIDILPDAAAAAERDRPGLYDNYLVADLCSLSEDQEDQLRTSGFNCLTTVAALGFGDIPPQAFANAFNLIATPGWLAFNIKDCFLSGQDASGFAGLIQTMNERKIIQVQAYRRYCHRLSIRGKRLYYVAVVARKLRDIPDSLMDGLK